MKKYIPSETTVIGIAMALGLLISGIFSAAQAKADLQNDIVRLHILADSDSEEAQELKIAVRDALLAASPELFEPYSTAEEAERSLSLHLGDIEEIAENTLREKGCGDDVHCELEMIPFDERVYGRFTVPAGEYTALRVVIGSGEGHNWWCVMYPPLCVPCAGVDMTDEEILEKYGCELSDEEILLITESGDFEARLYLAEVWERFFGGTEE